MSCLSSWPLSGLEGGMEGGMSFLTSLGLDGGGGGGRVSCLSSWPLSGLEGWDGGGNVFPDLSWIGWVGGLGGGGRVSCLFSWPLRIGGGGGGSLSTWLLSGWMGEEVGAVFPLGCSLFGWLGGGGGGASVASGAIFLNC